MSAEDYFTEFYNMFGHQLTKENFPELVSLLPVPEKRGVLFLEYVRFFKSASESSNNNSKQGNYSNPNLRVTLRQNASLNPSSDSYSPSSNITKEENQKSKKKSNENKVKTPNINDNKQQSNNSDQNATNGKSKRVIVINKNKDNSSQPKEEPKKENQTKNKDNSEKNQEKKVMVKRANNSSNSTPSLTIPQNRNESSNKNKNQTPNTNKNESNSKKTKKTQKNQIVEDLPPGFEKSSNKNRIEEEDLPPGFENNTHTSDKDDDLPPGFGDQFLPNKNENPLDFQPNKKKKKKKSKKEESLNPIAPYKPKDQVWGKHSTKTEKQKPQKKNKSETSPPPKTNNNNPVERRNEPEVVCEEFPTLGGNPANQSKAKIEENGFEDKELLWGENDSFLEFPSLPNNPTSSSPSIEISDDPPLPKKTKSQPKVPVKQVKNKKILFYIG